MASFYLIRHGETDWNVSRKVMGRLDTPLNSKGRSQATALAELMRDVTLDEIYTSPQLRARETAAAVGKISGKTPIVAPELAEVDFKRWEGMEWDELKSDPFFEAYRKNPARAENEGFESIPKVQARMVTFAEGLARKFPAGAFALVSHADPLRALLSHMLRQPLEEYRRLWFSNAGVTAVHGDPQKWVMSLFNVRVDPEWRVTSTS